MDDSPVPAEPAGDADPGPDHSPGAAGPTPVALPLGRQLSPQGQRC